MSRPCSSDDFTPGADRHRPSPLSMPCSGQTAVVFEWVTNIGIGLLFFSTALFAPKRSSPA